MSQQRNFKEGIRRGRRGVDESGGAEEAGARREDDEGVHAEVQVGSKREWV